MWQRRKWLLKASGCLGTVGVLGVSGLLAGCASAPPRKLNASGQACFAIRRPRRLICSDALAPSVATEQNIRELGGIADALTVYLVRRSIGDTGGAVPMTIDGRRDLTVPPFSMARLRLAPGAHRIAMTWRGEESALGLQGQAGDVRFVELRRSNGFWSWHARYEWRTVEPEQLARRSLDSRVIADLDLRPPVTS